MNIQDMCDEYPEDSRFKGPEYPGATHFIGPEYPGDLGMSRRFMLDRPLKELRNVKKSPGKFCHRIFCPGIKQGQKSWNFLLRQEKILEFSQKKISRIPGKNGIPGIFWSQNFPILERSVWKFSVLGFCFPENSGIPLRPLHFFPGSTTSYTFKQYIRVTAPQVKQFDQS